MDVLWHSASIFKKAEQLEPKSDWNGVMENIIAGCRHPEKSTNTITTDWP